MHHKIIIDSSAVIALINKEKGFQIVEKYLGQTVISSVNFSEVLTVLNREILKSERERKEGLQLIKHTFPQIVAFDDMQAIIAAEIDETTKKYGLSLGDRACLALAKYKKSAVLTADKNWKKFNIGIEVKLIR